MGGNFKFQAQDSFLELFFWEIGRFEKRISLSKKKAPLVKACSEYLAIYNTHFPSLVLYNFRI